MIEFEDVGFRFGPAVVLRETTLRLPPGTLNVLVGPAGSGKTTLLRLCYRDLEPTEGRVLFRGRPGGRRARNAIADLRRAIGVVPQEVRFLDHLTVGDNVALPLRAAGIDPATRAADLRALLEWVDLADRDGAPPAALSPEERQRAALARAVILSPELILADEPAGGADRAGAERIVGLLVELNRMGKSVMVACRDRGLARALAARAPATVGTLAGGRLEPAEIAA